MAKGWIVAAMSDMDAACEIAAGFGLEALDLSAFADAENAIALVAGADNVGVLISHAAARDEGFVRLLRLLAQQRGAAQIILAEDDARQSFDFLPAAWPVLSLADARHRADSAARRRGEIADAPHAAPLPATGSGETETPADAREEPSEEGPAEQSAEPESEEAAPEQDIAASDEIERGITIEKEEAPPSIAAPAPMQEPPPAPHPEESDWLRSATPTPVPAQPAPAAPRRIGAAERPSRAAAGSQEWDEELTAGANASAAAAQAPSAPADATAFAPKKLRRATPELVRVVIHQPQDLKAVIKAAKKIDPSADAAPQSMGIGDVAIGAKIGVALEVRGASCDGAVQRRTWAGAPLDFNFIAEADDDAKQAVILARVFINDAQIGSIAFTRPISGPKKKAADTGDGARLKRFKRVFLSYSSADRETVSRIATAYQMAGVDHFWDRTSLKSGEEWSPRLRKEIDKSDLFHLCWSKSAATSEWVEKEAEHALTRRQRSKGKTPSITVQMLDGPPWAPHPKHLDSINFDDFVRAAIVGYARGEG